MISKLNRVLRILRELKDLPKLRLRIDPGHSEGRNMYLSFTQRHPRFFVFRHKTMGVALIRLGDFNQFEDYLKTVNGKNSAAYYARRCSKLGYETRQFDPNQYQERILEINQSMDVRQGRPMPDNYRCHIDYPLNAYNRYWGVFKDGELVSYVWMVITGEVRILKRLLAHAGHMPQGVMYKMLVDLVKDEFGCLKQNPSVPVNIMYDTFFGASEGIRLFKRRLGFKPYKIKWIKHHISMLLCNMVVLFEDTELCLETLGI